MHFSALKKGHYREKWEDFLADISSSTQIFPVGRVGTAFYLFERISGQSFS
jgi:hypothetical protein